MGIQTAADGFSKSKKKTRRRGPRLTGISKQRRLANARERNRVQVLNENIERLRKLIPLFPDERKPSKTETIRLAALYIDDMTEILDTTDKLQNWELSPEQVMEEIEIEIAATPFDFDPFPRGPGVKLDLRIVPQKFIICIFKHHFIAAAVEFVVVVSIVTILICSMVVYISSSSSSSSVVV